MVPINFAEYGRPEWGTIELLGASPQDRKAGNKLVLLFAETHKEDWSIGPNAINCVKLIDAGIVGLVGLEYNPVDKLGLQKHGRTGDLPRDVATLLDHDRATIKEPRFGTTVDRLVDVPMSVMDEMKLWEKAGDVEAGIKEKHIAKKAAEVFAKLTAENPSEKPISLDAKARRFAEQDEEVRTAFREEFGEAQIQVDRDEAIVKNLLTKWNAVGERLGVILNAGSKHIPRVVKMLPQDVQFIWITQS